jgi:16S rRNA (guanine527-N7)-methyltransferase
VSIVHEFRALLVAEFAPYGQFSEQQLDLLEQHYDLMSRWNRKLNLTRINDLRETVQFHYCESLFLARSLPPHALRIVDVGSGAGFPGIPVAIFRPDCSIDLVESHQRKAVFLREASRDLPNVRVIAKRAEELPKEYDWAISRAVSPEDVLKLHLAPCASILGATGEKLPWGDGRYLFHVKQSST